MIDAATHTLICSSTGAQRVRVRERVQSLWSGYGEIVRVDLEGASVATAVVKVVQPPMGADERATHPRGWSSNRSHQRKLRSYAVEQHWYEQFASRCEGQARVPRAYACQSSPQGWRFVLEDLDAAGFALRSHTPDDERFEACLQWLARFHATFLGATPDGLWPTGTYWHLATRPDELAAMSDERLREAAPAIDAALEQCEYRTLVHGDAKVANMCFSAGRPARVAAVDFQYVGGGCGMKDLAYFFSSCRSPAECERHAPAWLDRYFAHLRAAMADPNVDLAALEAEWRHLYPLAWADFYRFLQGWAPDHGKINRYRAAMTELALRRL